MWQCGGERAKCAAGTEIEWTPSMEILNNSGGRKFIRQVGTKNKGDYNELVHIAVSWLA
jgi:hypothetical protein